MNTTETPPPGSLQRMVRRAVELFRCDTARVTSPCGHHYLILGWKRNTKTECEAGRDCGQWYRNDEPIDYDYTQEQVIANGATLKELWKSAKHYKGLLDASTPNDPSSATRPTRGYDCNREVMAGFAAAHG